MSASVHDRLKAVRQKQDIVLPRPPNFREKLIRRNGSEVPIVLRPYQIQMVVHLMAMRRFIVGDDCGLGKTIESIAGLCQLWKRDPDMKVVILTKKSSVPQWESEFAKFTPEEAAEGPRGVGAGDRTHGLDSRLLVRLQRHRAHPALGGLHAHSR
jgi:SNF2 family DNA or RNA helicase